MNYSFVVEGDPVAWGRAGTRIVKTKKGKSFIQFYTPTKTARYESLVYLSAMGAGVRPMSGPVTITINAYFERPDYMTSKKGFPSHPFPHTNKPDADNIQKGILDGLKKLFRDDCQVWCIKKSKWWCGEGERPRVEVELVEHAEHPEVLKRRQASAERRKKEP